MDLNLKKWRRTSKKTIQNSAFFTAGTTSTTTSTKWQRSKQVSIMKWRWKSFEYSNDRWLSVVIKTIKWTSAVYSSKAIGRWPAGSCSRRGLYGTEQAICNAPTGRSDSRSAGPSGVDGCGTRAAAVARGKLGADRHTAARPPWPRQHLCTDQHAQRANYSVWE